MILYPALDLKNGNCVRLIKGNFNDVTNYNNDPINQAKIFLENNFNYLHVVDLDGAQTGNQLNRSVIQKLLEISGLQIQVGGGIREVEDVYNMLELGVSRVIVGTAIFKEKFLDKIKENFDPDQIILAVDFNSLDGIPYIYTHGWQDNSNIKLFDFISDNSYFKNLLATDISLDGVLQGASFETYEQILRLFPASNLIASGGVSSMSDLAKLENLQIQECIVGKAIYEKKISLSDLSNDY